jgi:sensor histidine kinase YesM
MKFNVINQKATVAQINPHFIFNILNSINSDILLKDKKNASKTLVNFSNLMRQNLYNSAHALVSLENDLDALKFYLILEQNRMENFDFDIQLSHDVNVHQLLVPPMLIQPFVENVLRHAFIDKTEENRGRIIVSIQLIEDNLCCFVIDDGIGINQSLKNKEKSPLKKSMGMSITKERLVFLTKYYKKTFKLEITDKSDTGSHGTHVCFYLPFNRK